MEALKKAERTKQEQAAPHVKRASQPGGAAEIANSAEAPSPGLSLLPREEVTGHIDTTGSSDWPSITATQKASETPSSIPDLAPLTIERQETAPTRTGPAAPALELTLAEPPPPREVPIATLGIKPEAQPQPVISAKPDTRIPPAHCAEAHHKAPPQDVRKVAAAQQNAKTVFSAKQPAHSRTLLFTGAAAAVVLGLAGFGIYYWQITSTSTMLPPPNAPHAATAPISSDAAAPGLPANSAGNPQQPSVSAEPAQNPIDKPAPVSAQASPPTASAAYDPARDEARGAAESFKENPAIRIRQSAATSQLNPTLGKAYQSFLSGDTGTAQQLYYKVLQQESNNRDALLGMATIALKHKQAGQAAAYYGKLLELDPADPDALAGLIGLQGQSDPTQSESRLKKVLMQSPQADAAHFALGNLYAQQSRWAEAQQSYFRAYSSAPGNADYAFNLAVSLEHLNQGKLALDYYQRALAQPGPANFDKSTVQTRIKELLQPAGN